MCFEAPSEHRLSIGCFIFFHVELFRTCLVMKNSLDGQFSRSVSPGWKDNPAEVMCGWLRFLQGRSVSAHISPKAARMSEDRPTVIVGLSIPNGSGRKSFPFATFFVDL